MKLTPFSFGEPIGGDGTAAYGSERAYWLKASVKVAVTLWFYEALAVAVPLDCKLMPMRTDNPWCDLASWIYLRCFSSLFWMPYKSFLSLGSWDYWRRQLR